MKTETMEAAIARGVTVQKFEHTSQDQKELHSSYHFKNRYQKGHRINIGKNEEKKDLFERVLDQVDEFYESDQS